MKKIEYEVNVGSGCTRGVTYVEDDATREDIYWAICNCLYCVEYEVLERSKDELYIQYKVFAGGGQNSGRIIVKESASKKEILLAILDDLYEVIYEIKEE